MMIKNFFKKLIDKPGEDQTDSSIRTEQNGIIDAVTGRIIEETKKENKKEKKVKKNTKSTLLIEDNKTLKKNLRIKRRFIQKKVLGKLLDPPETPKGRVKKLKVRQPYNFKEKVKQSQKAPAPMHR